MRILIISDEVWNDEMHSNNILTSWFQDFKADFMNIYCSPGVPENDICDTYIQYTDKMILRGFLTRSVGNKFILSEFKETGEMEIQTFNKVRYRRIKKIMNEPLRLIRDLIWKYTRYDKTFLSNAINEFSPDMIFSARKSTLKILRIEKEVRKISKVPFVAFTGDSEYNLQQFRLSISFWIRRFMIRSSMRHNVKFYSSYYTFSEDQSIYYRKVFGRNIFHVLRKIGYTSVSDKLYSKQSELKFLYAGKLYSNRWKTLELLADILHNYNNEAETNFLLNIYTANDISRRIKKRLGKYNSVRLHDKISSKELEDEYLKNDVILHVESMDIRNKFATKYSFSTKIMDCLGSNCALFVISWIKHTGFIYTKQNNIGLHASNKKEIIDVISKLLNNTYSICDIVEKQNVFVQKYHLKSDVQRRIYTEFKEIIKGDSDEDIAS